MGLIAHIASSFFAKSTSIIMRTHMWSWHHLPTELYIQDSKGLKGRRTRDQYTTYIMNKTVIACSQQWINVGGNPIVRHAGVAARVRNKTCYPLGNGLRWTDPEVIALYFLFRRFCILFNERGVLL